MKKTIIILLIAAICFGVTAQMVMAAAAAPKGSIEKARVVEKTIIYQPPKVYKDYVASTPAPAPGGQSAQTDTGSNTGIMPGAPPVQAPSGNAAPAAPEAPVDQPAPKSNSLMFLVAFLVLAILVVGGGLGYVAMNKHKEIKERDF
ncbi:MAG: hypothetical protein LWY06_08285 [Firmicutes bacterium]|nr:hypothetical protein [Bacillota bacterium]